MRLFVAVNLTDEVRQAAWAAAEPLRQADLPVRWTAAGSLHITLQFLGEVPADRMGAIGAALQPAVAGARSFELVLSGYGAFPDERRPRVLWFGVERHPALELLANDVARALGPLGFVPELRPFAPHLTIGRVRDGAGAVGRKLAAAARHVQFEALLPVSGVDLMESRPGPEGSTYAVLRRAPLLPGA